MQYDLIILGAGPIGLACGIEAQKAGLQFVILEKNMLVNSLYHFPINMTFFSTSRLLEIGDIPFISHSDKPTRSEALEYYRRISQHWNLPIEFGQKIVTISQSGSIFQVAGSTVFTSKNLIIATGFYDSPVPLNIPGEQLPHVSHYFKDGHSFFGRKVAIIGGGNSACDAALECWQQGAEVTMSIRAAALKESIKYWIKPNIENRIKEGSIRAYYNSHVKEIKSKSIVISCNNEIKELRADFVLAMTGYQPDFALLATAGVAFHNDVYRTPLYNEETLETNVKGLYLAGVIIGGLKTNKWFIETTRDHGKKIIHQILKHR